MELSRSIISSKLCTKEVRRGRGCWASLPLSTDLRVRSPSDLVASPPEVVPDTFPLRRVATTPLSIPMAATTVSLQRHNMNSKVLPASKPTQQPPPKTHFLNYHPTPLPTPTNLSRTTSNLDCNKALPDSTHIHSHRLQSHSHTVIDSNHTSTSSNIATNPSFLSGFLSLLCPILTPPPSRHSSSRPLKLSLQMISLRSFPAANTRRSLIFCQEGLKLQ